MKKIFIILSIIISSFSSNATIHVVYVWDGYSKFLDADITIQLGDTVQWLPTDVPAMVHTITSTNIPFGAATFNQIWQAPADTFFQYVPQIAGLYEYECIPHATRMVGSINVIGGVTGITKAASTESNMLIIYPNPTTDFIHFTESSFVYPYKISTPMGKLVLSGKTNDIVNVSTLSNGIYHIQIVGDKPRIIKFIKQ
jgi:plastocyanin